MKVNFIQKQYYFLLLFVGLVMSSCSNQTAVEISVSNPLDFNRSEVVALNKSELLSKFKSASEDQIRLRNKSTAEVELIQWYDSNADGESDQLLFKAEVSSKSTSIYEVLLDESIPLVETDQVAYSRFVPERTDDYTWENDKVAFRVYGPTGQREALAGVPGSTMSSGVDLWLKRTPKSIINKWYARHVKTPGYYHIDHGEGYDPFHVGTSRGVGGIGVWEDDNLQVSRNYTAYRILANGPLRTEFELDYAPWSTYQIAETRTITLDVGSNFSKVQVNYTAEQTPPNITIGITLHKQTGEVTTNKELGWFSHWEKIDGNYVGSGLIVAPSKIQNSFEHRSETPDASHLFVKVNPEASIEYYSGFAWDRSDQISSKQDWLTILKQKTQTIAHPLELSFN